MEIILRERIDNLGVRGDVVTVSPGYARNYLLPKKLAVLATPANMKQIEQEKAAAVRREALERKRGTEQGRAADPNEADPSKVHGTHGPVHVQRTFRRKSG